MEMERYETEGLLGEFTPEELANMNCKGCQCGTCTNDDCPIMCQANITCDFPVTKCNDCKPALSQV